MATTQGARRRRRGEVEELSSGALMVRVYAGIDPVAKKRHNLVETVPPGPKAAAQAEKVRTRLLSEVDAGRQPRTSATVSRLMELRTRRGGSEAHLPAAWAALSDPSPIVRSVRDDDQEPDHEPELEDPPWAHWAVVPRSPISFARRSTRRSVRQPSGSPGRCESRGCPRAADGDHVGTAR